MHDPESYEKLRHSMGNRNLAAEKLLPPILNKMRIREIRNQNILDFGCGSGLVAQDYLVPIAEDTDSKIVGLDISEEMITHANSKYSSERMSFLCGDIMEDNFQLPDSHFDHIVSFYVLHFIQNYKEALRRLFVSLKPGGQAGFAISAKHNQFVSYKVLGQDPMWSQYMKGYEQFCPNWTKAENVGKTCQEYVEKAALEVGFKILDSTLRDMNFTAYSFNLYTRFLLTLNPFITKVPKELPDDLHRSLKSHLCKLYCFPDTEEFHSQPFTDTNYQILLIVLEKPIQGNVSVSQIKCLAV